MDSKKTGLLYLILAILTITPLYLFFNSILKDFIKIHDIGLYYLIFDIIRYGYFTLPCLIFMWIYKEHFTDYFGFHFIHISTIFRTLLFTLLISPGVIVINTITSMFFGNFAETYIFSDTENIPSYVMFLSIAIIAPFFEEIIFRGAFYHGFRRSGRVFASVFVSALLFGLQHANFNQLSYAFYIGIMFALLDEAAGSIWPSIISHTLFNGWNFFLDYIFNKIYEANITEDVYVDEGLSNISNYVVFSSRIIVFIIMTAVSIFCVWLAILLTRRIHLSESRDKGYIYSITPSTAINNKSSVRSICLIIGIIIMSAYTVIMQIIILKP